MKRRIFEPTRNLANMVGWKSQYSTIGFSNQKDKYRKVIALAVCSPFASTKRNLQLEKDLYKVYMRYYLRVCFDNCGLFWEQPTNEDCKEE